MKKLTRYSTGIVCVLSLSSSVFYSSSAAGDVIDQILVSRLIDPGSVNSGQGIPELSTGFKAWIDDPEARINVEDDGDSGDLRSTFSLRFSPVSARNQQVHRRIFDMRSDALVLQQDRSRSSSALQIYNRLLDLLNLETQNAQSQDRLKLLDVAARYHTQLASTGDFNPVALQKIRFDITKEQHKNKIRTLHKQQVLSSLAIEKLESVAGDTGVLSNGTIVHPTELQELVRSNMQSWLHRIVENDSTGNNVAVAIAKENLILAENENRFGLSLVEFEASEKSSSNSVGMTLGFRVPGVGNNRRIVARHFDIAESETRAQRIRAANSLDASELFLEFENLYSEWKIYSEIAEELDPVNGDASTLSPELVFLQAGEQHEMQRQAHEIHFEVVKTFLEIVFRTGLLTEAPMRNWIKSGQPLLHESQEG